MLSTTFFKIFSKNPQTIDFTGFVEYDRSMKKKTITEKSIQNLIPLNQRSEEEKKAIIEKGHATRSAKAQHRRTINQIAEAILKLNGNNLIDSIDNEALRDQVKSMNISVYDVAYLKMLDQTLKGNVKAFEAVRDSAGDKPTTKTENSINLKTESDDRLLKKIADRLGIETEDVIDADYTELKDD